MSLVLHDPATYAHGFPYEVFRALRDDDPVSHHDHPGWERRLLGGHAPRRRAAGLPRLDRVPERARIRSSPTTPTSATRRARRCS